MKGLAARKRVSRTKCRVCMFHKNTIGQVFLCFLINRFWSVYGCSVGKNLDDRARFCVIYGSLLNRKSWWRHQMETFSASQALCAGNSPVTGEFPSHKLVTRSFDVFFDLCLNKRLSKQSRRLWFETPSHPLWRHCNDCPRSTCHCFHVCFTICYQIFPNNFSLIDSKT